MNKMEFYLNETHVGFVLDTYKYVLEDDKEFWPYEGEVFVENGKVYLSY